MTSRTFAAHEATLRIRRRFSTILLAGILFHPAERPLLAQSPGNKQSNVTVNLDSLEQTVGDVYRQVVPAVVRITNRDSDFPQDTGVIVSPEGHILVRTYVPSAENPDDRVPVVTADGKRATAKRLGWSTEWGISLLKLDGNGPWPHVKMARTAEAKAGMYCLAIGYSARGDGKYDPVPALRFGEVTALEPGRWLQTSCVPGAFEYMGIFNVEGRLVGMISESGPFASTVTAADVAIEHWDDLTAGSNLDWVRFPPAKGSIYHLGAAADALPRTGTRRMDDVLGNANREVGTDSTVDLNDAIERATKCTVRLRSKERMSFDKKGFDQWSGVIVTDDGFILTCAHTKQLPGEQVTVCLSDGRDVPGVVLGTNPISDIGLVKISQEGKWPSAKMADSAPQRPGDPLVVSGYPARDARGNYRTDRQPQVDRVKVARTPLLLWHDEFFTTLDYVIWGGMSGGGVFNAKGDLVGVHCGGGTPRTEMVRCQWDELAATETIPQNFPLSLRKDVDAFSTVPPLREISESFNAVAKQAATAVVEIWSGKTSIALGTVVDSRGYVLSKASELLAFDDLEVRPAGAERCSATIVNVDREHDLALVKVDASGWESIDFARGKSTSVGTLLAAVLSDGTARPGVVSIETRAIQPEPIWLGEGLDDTDAGPEVRGYRRGSVLLPKDIILEVEGHRISNQDGFASLFQTDLRKTRAGDPIRFRVRRGGEVVQLAVPMPSAQKPPHMFLDQVSSPRRSGFPAAYDTDIYLTRNLCGGPVIGGDGRVVGLVIASRGRSEWKRGPTIVLPAETVAYAVARMMRPAHSGNE